MTTLHIIWTVLVLFILGMFALASFMENKNRKELKDRRNTLMSKYWR